MKIKNDFLTFILTVIVFLVSCKKTEIDNETQSVADNSLCEQEFVRIAPAINAIANGTEGVKKLIATVNAVCPTTTVSGDTTWANAANLPVLTISYGSMCVDIDGRTRSGDLVCSFSKPYDSTGCVVSVSLNNYFSSGLKYEGTLTITRLSLNSFNVKVANGKCTGNGWSVAYSFDRTFTQIAGTSTPANEIDDVFSFSGDADGISRNEKNFHVKTLGDLQKSSDCKWISAGKSELTPTDLTTRVVDYGGGDCDNKAAFTVNGNTFEFALK